MKSMKLKLGPVADAVELALSEALQEKVVQRIWQKDASLWKTEPKAQENIRASLGWLTVANHTDFPIPGEDYTFSILKQAQAIGDFQALSRRGRRALGISIDNDGGVALKRLLDS